MGIEPTPVPQPARDNGFEDWFSPVPSVMYLLGSSWLSGLIWEDFMLLCHSRVTVRLRPSEDPRSRARGHHLQASHRGRQNPLHGLYTPERAPQAIPDLRPEGGRHPMGQAARNRRPDRALPTQPGSLETDPGGPDRPLHRAYPS